MTDKQIIIDEAKCPWFNDGSCDLFYSDKEECWYRKCKDTPNCYYRETQTQLKRKEKECEKLKKDNNCFQDRVCKLKLAVLRLTDDNDILKAENERLINKGRIECLYCEYKNTKADLVKLKQTLAEIKDYCNKYPQNSIGFKQQILQKISEVIPNEN